MTEAESKVVQKSFVIRFFQVLIICGIAMKLYGLNDPWKRHDHYNFGGIVTTAYAECLKSTPLEISKGVPHSCQRGFDDKSLHFYRAHPPSILFAMWGWTSLLGSAEWAYRLFIFFFSTLNIGLVFLIARRARPDSSVFPWIAAAFQACFLGNIYFGTHLDFIGEFTVFFILATALAALDGRLNLACLLGLFAGFSAWPGYIVFGPLWLYTLMIGRGRKRVFLTAIAGFVCALLTMMWLQGTSDIVEFLRFKLLSPGYIAQRERGWSEPFRFILNFFTSQARLLSPLFAAMAFFELSFGEGKRYFIPREWRNLTPFHHAVLLAGGTGLCYALIGHEYLMVHVYLYLLMTPGMALLTAHFCERVIHVGSLKEALESQGPRSLAIMSGLILLCAAVYPYGIFQTSLVHDVINSVSFISASLAAIYFLRKTSPNPKVIYALIALSAAANASQVANYRNEPDTERSFCQQAREEYARTGKPVETTEEESDAKDLLYCVGIPVIYKSQTAKPNL